MFPLIYGGWIDCKWIFISFNSTIVFSVYPPLLSFGTSYLMLKVFCAANVGFQGIWLCEHRDDPTARRVVVTLNGM